MTTVSTLTPEQIVSRIVEGQLEFMTDFSSIFFWCGPRYGCVVGRRAACHGGEACGLGSTKGWTSMSGGGSGAPGIRERRKHQGGDEQDGDAECEALPPYSFLEPGESQGVPAQVFVEHLSEGRVAFIVRHRNAILR